MGALQERRSEATRMAWLLGLPALNDLDLVRRVERGFPAKAADTLARRVDPMGRFFRATDIIPRSTYHRRVKARQALTKEESERLFALAKVFSELIRQYQSDLERAAEFLGRKHALLGGRTPLDVAKESTAGADLVLKVLARADAGVAV
jgi:putative toxin-antitoxin system antitoxin component (TIGR02293 family)